MRPGLLTREYLRGPQGELRISYPALPRFHREFFALSTVVEREPTFEADEAVEVGALGRILGLEEMSPEEANQRVNEAQKMVWWPRAM